MLQLEERAGDSLPAGHFLLRSAHFLEWRRQRHLDAPTDQMHELRRQQQVLVEQQRPQDVLAEQNRQQELHFQQQRQQMLLTAQQDELVAVASEKGRGSETAASENVVLREKAADKPFSLGTDGWIECAFSRGGGCGIGRQHQHESETVALSRERGHCWEQSEHFLNWRRQQQQQQQQAQEQRNLLQQQQQLQRRQQRPVARDGSPDTAGGGARGEAAATAAGCRGARVRSTTGGGQQVGQTTAAVMGATSVVENGPEVPVKVHQQVASRQQQSKQQQWRHQPVVTDKRHEGHLEVGRWDQQHASCGQPQPVAAGNISESQSLEQPSAGLAGERDCRQQQRKHEPFATDRVEPVAVGNKPMATLEVKQQQLAWEQQQQLLFRAEEMALDWQKHQRASQHDTFPCENKHLLLDVGKVRALGAVVVGSGKGYGSLCLAGKRSNHCSKTLHVDDTRCLPSGKGNDCCCMAGHYNQCRNTLFVDGSRCPSQSGAVCGELRQEDVPSVESRADKDPRRMVDAASECQGPEHFCIYDQDDDEQQTTESASPRVAISGANQGMHVGSNALADGYAKNVPMYEVCGGHFIVGGRWRRRGRPPRQKLRLPGSLYRTDPPAGVSECKGDACVSSELVGGVK